MRKKEAEQMLNTKQFADHFKVAYTTVMTWLNDDIVPGARLVPTPRGDVWEIPMSTLEIFTPPKRGRPKKAADSAANGQTATKPAKKVTKKAGN